MSKKNTVHTAKVIQPFYYIIKVVLGDIGKTVYKIGETHVDDKRPQELIKKYSDRRANSAELIKFDKLPISKGKRMTDSKIRSILLSSNKKFKKADRNELEIQLRETDGINEFVSTTTLLTDDEILAAVQTAIDIAKTKAKGYSADVRYYTELNYDPTQYHLVDFYILERIKNQFPNFYASIYNCLDIRPLVLVGQFKPEWISSFAAFKKVVIWHDSSEQQYEYPIAEVAKNITYINTLEDLIDMDLTNPNILANLPYGAAGGAKITTQIKNQVKFSEFINLLPANDYKDTDIYKYTRDMIVIKEGFKDAVVTTHLCRIVTDPSNISLEEFEISQFEDTLMKKYFYQNRVRSNYAIDSSITWLIFAEKSDMTRTVLIDHRCIPHKHLAYSKTTDEYKWNKLESIDNESLEASSKSTSTPGKMNKYVIKFDTAIEKQNLVNFMYSKDGFRFISKICVALNTDSTLALSKWFPKVDWTRAWTVEELLADYGYTPDEIAGVMADLDNFTSMED